MIHQEVFCKGNWKVNSILSKSKTLSETNLRTRHFVRRYWRLHCQSTQSHQADNTKRKSPSAWLKIHSEKTAAEYLEQRKSRWREVIRANWHAVSFYFNRTQKLIFIYTFKILAQNLLPVCVYKKWLQIWNYEKLNVV